MLRDTPLRMQMRCPLARNLGNAPNASLRLPFALNAIDAITAVGRIRRRVRGKESGASP
jgi:hypothetical protein